MNQRLFSQGWIGLTQIVILASLTALTTIATTNQPSHAEGTLVENQNFKLDIDFDKINTSSATVKSGRKSGIPINILIQLSQGFSEPLKTTKLKADDFLVQAVDKYEIGDYRGAILAYDEVIRLTPNNSEALLYRGNAYYNLGDKQAAIQDYNQSLKINPNYADAYYSRGNALSALGDKQAAIQDYNQSLKINPNYADAYNNRGNARYDLEDKQAAIQDYNQSLKINPNYADAYYNRGNARDALGDKQAAIQDYNRAIKINPNYADAYYNRGNAYATLGDKFQARSDFQQAAKIYQQQGNNENYQDALNKEQFQIYGDLTQTRVELKSTCTNTIRICTFSIEDQKISVRLTPEYDRLFQANNPQIQSHFQSLKDALKAISQNAQLPVFIYNSQGQERYMWQPA